MRKGVLRTIILVIGIFITSVSFGDSMDSSATGEFPVSPNLIITKDSLLYHSYAWGSTNEQRCYYWEQMPWVFVKFSPTPQQIALHYNLSGIRWRYSYLPTAPFAAPGTLAVWNSSVAPANEKLLLLFWKPEAGQTPVYLINNGWKFLLTGDFWIGYCGVHNPAGYDSIFPNMDITCPASPCRNYYSFGSRYAAQSSNNDYDNIITAYIETSAGTETNILFETEYLKPSASFIPGNKEIRFEYKILKETVLSLYGIDGSKKISTPLTTGGKEVILRHNLPSGIYFYRLNTNQKQFSGKLLIL
ncbi:MAG: T9SS type A sorting domain-containing protein [bacterium]|nr:T9SS type A sorting domain-containing protein [bacterium]